MVNWLFATLHLLALGIGMGAIWYRSQALSRASDPPELRRVFLADALWGGAALLWLITGLARAFGGLEKGTDYYLASPAFHLKMGLFVVILLLELWPMVSLIRWRIDSRRGREPDLSHAMTFARISKVQTVLLVLMVFAATAMARGIGSGA